MREEGVVSIVFPPYVYALGRPYMAPAQLVASLRGAGITARSVDLNLRFSAWLARRGGELDEFERTLIQEYCALQARLRTASRLGPQEASALRSIIGLLPSCSRAILKRELGDLGRQTSSFADSEPIAGAPRRTYLGFAEEHGVAREASVEALLARAGAGLDRDPFWQFLTSTPGRSLVRELSGSAVVGISLGFWQQLYPALLLARAVKAAGTGSKIILGGPQITLLAEPSRHAMVGSDLVDALTIHDGETPLEAFARAVQRGEHWSVVPSLVFQDHSGPVSTPTAPPVDLDTLPVPEYDDDELRLYPGAQLRLRVLATRGCYWGRCQFCDYPAVNTPSDARYRRRSPQRVVQDVKDLQRRHGVFAFELATESLPPDWAQEFSDRIAAERITASFAAFMRPEGAAVLTPSLMRSMRRAGFEWIAFGAETTSDRLLDQMNKGTSFEKVRESLYAAEVAGIEPMTSWIPDLPTVTRAELEHFVAFLEESRDVLSRTQVQPLDLRPTSPMVDRAEEFGVEIGAVVAGSRGLHSLTFARKGGLAGDDLDALVGSAVELQRQLQTYRLTVANRERIGAVGFSWNDARVVFAEAVAVRSRFALGHGGVRHDVVVFASDRLEGCLELSMVYRRTIDLIASHGGEPVSFAAVRAAFAADSASATPDADARSIESRCVQLLKDCVYSGFITRVFGGGCFEPPDTNPDSPPTSDLGPAGVINIWGLS